MMPPPRPLVTNEEQRDPGPRQEQRAPQVDLATTRAIAFGQVVEGSGNERHPHP